MVEKFHPSEYIRDEMDARGWSQTELARRMGGDLTMNLVALELYLGIGPDNPGIRLGLDTAAQLGLAFGVSAEYFLNLEQAWLS